MIALSLLFFFPTPESAPPAPPISRLDEEAETPEAELKPHPNWPLSMPHHHHYWPSRSTARRIPTKSDTWNSECKTQMPVFCIAMTVVLVELAVAVIGQPRPWQDWYSMCIFTFRLEKNPVKVVSCGGTDGDATRQYPAHPMPVLDTSVAIP